MNLLVEAASSKDAEILTSYCCCLSIIINKFLQQLLLKMRLIDLPLYHASHNAVVFQDSFWQSSLLRRKLEFASFEFFWNFVFDSVDNIFSFWLNILPHEPRLNEMGPVLSFPTARPVCCLDVTALTAGIVALHLKQAVCAAHRLPLGSSDPALIYITILIWKLDCLYAWLSFLSR